MNRRALGIMIVTAALMGGCEQQPNVLSRLLVQPGTAADLDYSIQWQTNLGLSDDERLIYTELLGDRLTTLESGNIVSIIDARTSEVLWRDRVGQDFERFSKPVRVDDQLLLCSESRAYVYDINYGDLLKVFPLEFSSGTTPALYRDMMIHGSPSGLIFAQELELGLLRWRYQTGASITNNPYVAGDTLLVTNAAGDILAFNLRDGNIIWRDTTYERISADLASSEGLVYAASEDQSLYAFDIATGDLAWRYFARGPLTRKPTQMADVVLLPVPFEGLVAFGAADGEPRWEREELIDARPLMLRGNEVYLHRPEARLIEIIDINSGETLQQTPIPAVHHVFAENIDGGNLYLVRTNGRIMKLTPR